MSIYGDLNNVLENIDFINLKDIIIYNDNYSLFFYKDNMIKVK